MKPVNVLVTAASRRVGLVRAFCSAVERYGRGRVVTTDINTMSPALYFGHRSHIVPLTTDPDYIPMIEGICDADDIHMIVPTIDDELPMFGRLSQRFRQNGVWVAASGEEAARTANDKYRMHEFALAHGIAVPRTWLAGEADPGEVRYPAVVKPRHGRGSIQVFQARGAGELEFFAGYVPDAIVQEYVEGTEFTVDVCCDFEGRVLAAVPRERLLIRAGVSDRGVTRRNRAVMDFAVRVAECLGIVGAANVQCKWDGRRVVLLEVNPRFSGGIPLTIAAGADFPAWLVQLRAGRAVPPQLGRFQADLAMMSFEENVFAEAGQLQPSRGERRRLARTRWSTAYVN